MSPALRALLGKEWRELRRDRLSLGLALLLPLLLLLLFTYGLNLDAPQVRLGILDLDRSALSRDYLTSLAASGDLQVAGAASAVRELEEWLDRDDIHMGLVIGPGFEREVLAGRSAPVQVLADGSIPTQARVALAEFDAATALFSHRLLHDADLLSAQALPAVALETRVWFNPDLKSVNYIVPGLFSLILITFSPLLSTLAIVRERERGSIQQILVAPVSRTAFILGKATPYAALAFVQFLMVLALGLLWFRTPFRGSLPAFLLAAVVYVFCTVGIGLLVSTITRSQVVAMVGVLVATLMPSFLFSGFLFPVYSMPERYQLLSLLFPARHFTEIARGMALKGLPLTDLWPQVFALLAFTFALLALAVSRFHRRMG